jgi:hypothetical protein
MGETLLSLFIRRDGRKGQRSDLGRKFLPGAGLNPHLEGSFPFLGISNPEERG